MKENQVDFENDIPLNMGQWLSIPFIVIGLIIFVKAIRSGRATWYQGLVLDSALQLLELKGNEAVI